MNAEFREAVAIIATALEPLGVLIVFSLLFATAIVGG